MLNSEGCGGVGSARRDSLQRVGQKRTDHSSMCSKVDFEIPHADGDFSLMSYDNQQMKLR